MAQIYEDIIIHIIIVMEQSLTDGDHLSSSQDHYSQQFTNKLFELQGQCRIKRVIFLQINYIKGIVLTFLLSITIVGLLLLKYYRTLRAKVFYDQIESQYIENITHIYVEGMQNQQEISDVLKITFDQQQKKVFEFRKLKYEIYQDKCLPVGFPYIKRIGQLRREPMISTGLSNDLVSKIQQFYGKNEHRVQIPSYPQFLFDTMTQPFFLFQYFVSFIYILQNTAIFGVLMIVFGFITTSINYVLSKRSYNKIKETAEKQFKVKVFRNSRFEEINNIDMVPGDLYEPSQEIPCDSLVVRGEMFVNEMNLTGENVPIAKFKIVDDKKHNNKSHWLYEGSKVETMKEHTLAVAVNVGYGSQRGRIIRKILNKQSKQPQFFKKVIWFQIQVMAIGFIIYLLALPQLLSLDIDTTMVIFRLFDFVTYAFPAPFPIFFNLAYSFCLVRLNKENIIGTQAEKTVQSSRMKTICFDKTGTLTQNKMEVSNIYAFSKNKITDITSDLSSNTLIANLFASCNSVELINDQVKGDQIDLRMFLYVDGMLSASKKAGIVREILVGGRVLQILKINQYQSQFQSMSILLREESSGKHFVFIKGSPEMIHHYSVKKIEGYDKFIKKLSFSGFRSIGFGYKQLNEREVEECETMSREDFLRETVILGVVAFVNQLKSDAKSTISTLADCDINTKIITGDNIFLGIQTAIMIGMIPEAASITVVEGKNYNKANNSLEVIHLHRNENGQLDQSTERINNFEYQQVVNHYYAVDNDFIKQNPDNFLHDKVKVFARISPENKALIVRKHKEKILQSQSNLSAKQKLLKECSYKVGMVGDGANDLIAIKQAHVGIGISSSDAVYSASFAVLELADILKIILQSKNTERQIVQMTKYYGMTQFTSITLTLLMSTDSSYFTSIQLIYKNFLSTLIITLFLGMTRPAKQMCRYLNNSNLLDLENHLVYWGTMIIYGAGLVGSYVYFTNSGDFVPNTEHKTIKFPDGWYGETQSSTVNFITSIIVFALLPLAIYRSSPWKLPIWTNLPVTIVVIGNILLILPISFFTSNLGFFGLKPIGRSEISVIWLIMLGTSVIVILMNNALEKYFFNKMKDSLQGSLQNDQELKTEP